MKIDEGKKRFKNYCVTNKHIKTRIDAATQVTY